MTMPGLHTYTDDGFALNNNRHPARPEFALLTSQVRVTPEHHMFETASITANLRPRRTDKVAISGSKD
jgi:hypothetical protein